MHRDFQQFVKRGLLSAMVGSAIGGIVYATFLFFFHEPRGSIGWLPFSLLLFGPLAFLGALPIAVAVMGLIVAPITWPMRRLLVRHRFISALLLGISGWLLGKWVSVQWLRGGAVSVPYDPDGNAGPIFGFLCCVMWAKLMPTASRDLSTPIDAKKYDLPSEVGAALSGSKDV